MQTLIQAKQLSFSYGSKKVLTDINFEIYSGEIIGLIGENGAGKTTLLNILLGSYKADGQLHVFGRQPGNKLNKALIGVMPQNDMRLQSVTVADLLTEVAACYETSLNPKEVLRDLQLSDLARMRLTRLSGGQLRRVSFAIALISNPEVLFLDEPTVGLDVNARQDFWRRIALLKQQGKTIVIINHYLNEIEDVADRILIMKNGQFVFQGSLGQLQQNFRQVKMTFQTRLPFSHFQSLPAVIKSDQTADSIQLVTTSEDQTLAALSTDLPQLHHLRIEQKSLEDIFIALTRKGHTDESIQKATRI
ncbi:ABC transporter ATP-binding protein [Pediococcus siamensis]|uniref:ABC transporter ATP-binding protein n=1 Tax=Pediococcus siamensis TaxID=381829 RepID=UPI0039A25E1D